MDRQCAGIRQSSGDRHPRAVQDDPERPRLPSIGFGHACAVKVPGAGQVCSSQDERLPAWSTTVEPSSRKGGVIVIQTSRRGLRVSAGCAG